MFILGEPLNGSKQLAAPKKSNLRVRLEMLEKKYQPAERAHFNQFHQRKNHSRMEARKWAFGGDKNLP